MFGFRNPTNINPEAHIEAVAAVWLLQTSTDPLVHRTASNFAPLIQWTHALDTFDAAQIPINLLDMLLVAIVDPSRSHWDGEPPRLALDRAHELFAAFLILYWEKYVSDPEEVTYWTRRHGLGFYRSAQGNGILNSLRHAGPMYHSDGGSGLDPEADIVRLMFTTLSIFPLFDQGNYGTVVLSPCRLWECTLMGTVALRVAIYLSRFDIPPCAGDLCFFQAQASLVFALLQACRRAESDSLHDMLLVLAGIACGHTGTGPARSQILHYLHYNVLDSSTFQ